MARTLSRRDRVLLALTVAGAVIAFPLFVLWYGVKEAPSLAGELLDGARAVRTGSW